jgi:hypothetical protein
MPACRCLAFAFAHLGRDAEAREAAARVLETDTAFTISAWFARGGQSNAKNISSNSMRLLELEQPLLTLGLSITGFKPNAGKQSGNAKRRCQDNRKSNTKRVTRLFIEQDR